MAASAALSRPFPQSPPKPRGDIYRQVAQEFRHYVRSLPPLDPHIDREGTEMDTASVGRKLRSTDERITKAYTAERIAFALQTWGRGRASPIKLVQNIADVDRATAAAWYNGKHPPQTEHLLTLARKIPELKGEVRRLLCMEADLDPDFQREFTDLIRRYQR